MIATVFYLLLVGCVVLLIWSSAIPNIFVYIEAGLVGSTLFLMFYVACKDPGYINIRTYDSSKSTHLTKSQNDINDDETLFQQAHIYQARYCSTCKITRPPLSSHCKHCNVCVIGFDHHCTVVNKCVGVRNHRAFVLCLLFAWLSFVWLMCFSLYDFAYDIK